ncbi:hypothetical protein JY96_21625 [Aquabacterium sp. NJ1]|uniref:hypothetical protein n=1 Tax=Aquabacterium sp. NJ1 TaxID=1538295 RepID=UPI00052E2196|nr:hypothetical protein [Aquabacterium sp. NJ1]KGM38627.1 hypothetical protein JY96_21625 [Aquabacterium sp. NJ1]
MIRTKPTFLIALLGTQLMSAAHAGPMCKFRQEPTSAVVFTVNGQPIRQNFISVIAGFYRNGNSEGMAIEKELFKQAAISEHLDQGADFKQKQSEALTQLQEVMGSKYSDFSCTVLNELASVHALLSLYVAKHLSEQAKPSSESVESFYRTYQEQYKGTDEQEAKKRIQTHLWEQAMGKLYQEELMRLHNQAQVRRVSN